MPTPGSHEPYLTGRICPGYLVPGPPSPPLICSWSLLGPCPEGSSHRPPEGQEGIGGGLFSKPCGEAPGHTVFADLALQLTSTGLVTVTAIYSYCLLWVLSHERLVRTWQYKWGRFAGSPSPALPGRFQPALLKEQLASESLQSRPRPP